MTPRLYTRKVVHDTGHKEKLEHQIIVPSEEQMKDLQQNFVR